VSILQEWAAAIPIREQGVLLAGTRSCDTSPKVAGRTSNDRKLTAWIRWAFLNPADEREVGIEGAFFNPVAPIFRPSEFGHMPQHWYSHAMHAAQVIAIRHPDPEVRTHARRIYVSMVENMHLEPERDGCMVTRLSEDRIANGTVVS
jgi:hypothetical protein